MKFPNGVLESIPCWHGMLKVSVRKIIKIFGPFSGVATSLAEQIDD